MSGCSASAVAADVVAAARNIGKHVPVFWKDEKAQLFDLDSIVRRFYVRVSGTPEAKLSEIGELFGKVTVKTLEKDGPDFCFITDYMSEKDFNRAFEKLDAAIIRIRINR